MHRTYLFVGPVLFLLSYSIIGYKPFSEGFVRDENIMVELRDINGSNVNDRREIQDEFLRTLTNMVGYNYRVTSRYENFANVITLSINKNDLNLIKNISCVENASILTSYQIDGFDPYGDTVVAPDKNYSRIEMNYPTNTNNGAGTIVAIIDDSFNVTHEMYKDLDNNYKYSKNEMTSIKATSSFTGKNGAYKDNKIPYYYNYGDKNTEMTFNRNTTYHGSHVAGIAGANNTFLGTAPETQLALMKVTNSLGLFLDSAILSALEDAVIMNVDAINMSFGTSLQDFNNDNKYTSLFKKINEKGIACNVAAGNDGREQHDLSASQNLTTGASETGQFGTFNYSNDVNTVAALNLSNDATINSSVATIGGTSIRIRDNIINHKYTDSDGTSKEQIYNKIQPFYSLVGDGQEFTTLEYVVIPNLGKDEDYEDVDVKGKIAVIQRGTITFAQKIKTAISYQAKAILIYNNKEATAQVGYFDLGDIDETTLVPCAYINSSDGELLINQADKRLVIGKEYSGDYSSDGSSADLSLKPDIATPGTNIYSGIGPANNEYAFYNGTSMATPNFTGAIATLISDYNEKSDSDLFNYKSTLMNRFMSTSNPLKQTNGAYYSPRKVGSGELDLSGAIKSPVYFEGNVDKKAKIELKNNDDIKNGKINLNFSAINESNSSLSYKATVYVQAPELTGVDVTAKGINSYKFQTDKDILLTSFASDVVLESGTNNLNFKGEISEANKEYLAQFENGTYLEGYVVLTSLSGNEDLSIPYMGFYGDYYKESAVEPFSFEKDKNQVYGSDLLNSVANDYKLSSANFSSLLVTYNTKLTSLQISNILNNQASYLTYGNEALYDKENNKLILGIDGVSSYFSVQQYVNRTVKDNDVTLKNVSTNEVVFKDKLHSLISDKNNLNKSLITASYLNHGYLADRAVIDVSLVDENGNLKYSEGEYTLSFVYYLANGKTETKEYSVTIARTTSKIAPIFVSNEVIEIDSKKYIRIRFKGSLINKVLVNNEIVDFSKDDNSYYFDLSYDNYYKVDNVFINIIDFYSNTSTITFDPSSIDDGAFGIISSELKKGDKLLTSVELMNSDSNGDYYRYIFNIYFANSGNGSLLEEHEVFFNSKKGYVNSKDTIKVYSVNSDGSVGAEQNYTLNGNTVVFKTTASEFIVLYTEKEATKEEINYTPYIVIGSIGGVLLIGAIVTLIIILGLKKKERSNPVE